MNISDGEMILRLVLATLIGAGVGVNREVRTKPAGLKTMTLVAIGSAVAAILAVGVTNADANSVSRIMQGVLTGVGFLGAGVILHRQQSDQVEGLTTAATVWVVAGLGLAAGMGRYLLLLVTAAITMVVLVVGRWLTLRLHHDSTTDDDQDA